LREKDRVKLPYCISGYVTSCYEMFDRVATLQAHCKYKVLLGLRRRQSTRLTPRLGYTYYDLPMYGEILSYLGSQHARYHVSEKKPSGRHRARGNNKETPDFFCFLSMSFFDSKSRCECMALGIVLSPPVPDALHFLRESDCK
jgi:hypothetical protein